MYDQPVLFALAIVVLVLAFWLARTPRRQLRDGPACPRCDYPARGADFAGRCPECGADWSATGLITPGPRWQRLARRRPRTTWALVCLLITWAAWPAVLRTVWPDDRVRSDYANWRSAGMSVEVDAHRRTASAPHLHALQRLLPWQWETSWTTARLEFNPSNGALYEVFVDPTDATLTRTPFRHGDRDGPALTDGTVLLAWLEEQAVPLADRPTADEADQIVALFYADPDIRNLMPGPTAS